MMYMAYGSNMSVKRMKERNIKFLIRKQAILVGYKMVINKMSYKDKSIGYANVVECDGCIVEGAVYEIDDNDIFKLDKYEGYPKHYNRKTLKVATDDGSIDAVVYIANDRWVSNSELCTTEDYKSLLLEGKDVVSDDYYNKISKIKTK